MFPVVCTTCEPKLGAILVPAIAAEAFMSAFNIVPSSMFAETTLVFVGKVPEAIFATGILASAILLPSMFALLLTSALTILPSTILAEAT